MVCLLVKEIMSQGAVTITPQESAALAARLLARHNVGSLPVCSQGGELRGVITDRDILLRCVAAERDPAQLPVGKVMSRSPAFVDPEDDVRRAAHQMARHQIRRLPVVQGGQVVGMLSLGDLARCGRCEMEVSAALTELSGSVRRP